MKGRGGGVGGGGGNGRVPKDLMVCFPTRAHLTIMPKPICSPSRPNEPAKRYRHPAGRPHRTSSPLFKSKLKNSISSDAAEPTSPKVTCAGQIKVPPTTRRSTGGEDNWASVVEQMERLHKRKKRPNWLEAHGLKKDLFHVMGFLRGLKITNFSCFGHFSPTGVHYTDDDDDDDDEDVIDDDIDEDEEEEETSSSDVFSKWFMVLEENQHHHLRHNQQQLDSNDQHRKKNEENQEAENPPPKNALLLMRCRSAPEKRFYGKIEEDDDEDETMTKKKIVEEAKHEKLINYAPDILKISTDVAKETWVVGNSFDPLARSRSWRR